MMEVDSPHTIVPMSHWPVVVKSQHLLQSQIKPSESSESISKIQSSSYSVSVSSSIRRKPKVTYRAPEADTPLRVEGHPRSSPIISSTNISSRKTETVSTTNKCLLMPPPDGIRSLISTAVTIHNRATSPIFTPSPPLFKMRSPLPNYHPLFFKTTMPSLDAWRKSGLNNIAPVIPLVSDEDRGSGRRSSSRTRKPAAKIREAERLNSVEENKESITHEAVDLGMGGTKKESPKRKRANAASGSRKRKRDNTAAVERDTPYPKRKSRATRITEAANAPIVEGDHNDNSADNNVDVKANAEQDESGNDVEAVSLKEFEEQQRVTVPTIIDSRNLVSLIAHESTATKLSISPSVANIDAQSDSVGLDTQLSNLNGSGSPRKSSRRSVVESGRFKVTRRNSATSVTTTQTDKAENPRPSMSPAPQPKRVKTLLKESVVNQSNTTTLNTSIYKSKNRKALEETASASNPDDTTFERISQMPAQQSTRNSRKAQALPDQDVDSNNAVSEEVATFVALDVNELESQKTPASRKSASRRRGISSVIGNPSSTARNKSRARTKVDRHNSGASETSAAGSAEKEQQLLTSGLTSGEVTA